MMYKCPICGRETEYHPELNGLCEECFRKKMRPKVYEVKTHERIIVCRDCYSIRVGRDWVEPKPRYLENILQRIAKKTFKGYTAKISKDVIEAMIPLLSSEGEIRVPIKLFKNGLQLGNHTIIVEIKHSTCPICIARKTGGYWTFIAHVRAITREGKKEIREIEKLVFNILPDADIKRQKNGFDIRSSDAQSGIRFVNEMKRRGAIIRHYLQRKKIMKGRHEIVINKYLIQI